MIVLGVDLGERRIGVAVSDPLTVAARPLAVIEHKTLAEDVFRIAELAAGRRAERIVVGLPLRMDGSAGQAARRARRFANALRRQTDAEVVFWDERLTTAQAERALVTLSRPRDHRRESIDKAAAAVILQSYLDSQRESETR